VVELAILHQTLPTYMEQDPPEESKHLEVVLKASDLETFRAGLRGVHPRVLVLDLLLLGDDPQGVVKALEEAVKPELTMIVYAFAKWDLVEALRADRRHVLRAPISVRALRANLIHLIVRSLLGEPKPAAPATLAQNVLPTGPAPARRFDDVQLAHLQEVIPNVDCECPNQVADLVLALNAFENYSHECKNRNAEDAKVHAMLARATGHARALMELAMTELCEFEKIDINQLSHRKAGVPANGV
jgi:DNA-binding NarL/FixJ family response regulator